MRKETRQEAPGEKVMPNINRFLAGIDNARRVGMRNLSDLVQNPADYLDQTGYIAAQNMQEAVRDPASYIGGGIGRVIMKDAAGRVIGSAPTQAELAGRLHSMGMVDDLGANRLYNMRSADPELLELVEREAVRRGRLKDIIR